MMFQTFDWHRSFWCLLFVPLLLQMTGVIVVVDATGALELRMNYFTNPTEHLEDGSCCDLFCISKCDDIFQFALDQSSGYANDPKTYYYLVKVTGTFQDQDNNYFNDDMEGVENPIIWQFDSWPGSVLFKVYIEDDDSPFTSNDPLDGMIQRLTLTPAKSKSLATATTLEIRGIRPRDKTTLSFDYKLYCDDNYYGSACSIFCIGVDSSRGHYTCDPDTGAKVCRPEWEDLSTNCTVFADDCIGNGCLNGARCIDGLRSYTCGCAPGYTGVRCETNINECLSHPCLNGGTCSDLVNGYVCSCTTDYVGPQCGQVACQGSNPCRHGGTCYGNLDCLCPTGYVGNTCELRTCEAFPCVNGGSCTANSTCVCPAGFTGNQCEVRICDFVSAHCENGGICVNGLCSCPSPFLGVNCESEACQCSNGGSCVGVAPKVTCSCLSGFTGLSCETPIQSNDSTPSPLMHDDRSVDVSIFDGDSGVLLIVLIVICIVLLIVVIALVIFLICQRRKKRFPAKKRTLSTVSALTHMSSVDSSTASTTHFDNFYTADDVFASAVSPTAKDLLDKPWKKPTKEVGKSENENHYERIDAARGYVDNATKENEQNQKYAEIPELPERLPSNVRELPEHVVCDIRDIHGDPIHLNEKLADC